MLRQNMQTRSSLSLNSHSLKTPIFILDQCHLFFFCMNKSIEYQKIFKVTQWQRLYSLENESVLKINIRVGEMNSDRWHWWQHKHCCIGPNSYIKIYNLSKGWKMLPLFLIPISNFQNSISKLLILKFTSLVQSIAAFDSKTLSPSRQGLAFASLFKA